ncbi:MULTISPECIES: hypothetical protein [unclassified Adlercreutzia]|uniref:hypothetical protein n=1 Tax=unclassified Adlercreutzia TaxID=2636013 RepID=UPI0013ECC3C2|nr:MULTISPECIES: hypothetical protein [unclassified Adlercreutzia]
MSENEKLPQIDLSWFSLEEMSPVSITLPPAPAFGEEDVDAQLFGYVARAEKGSGIHAISDLDDNWVKAHFPDLSSIAELREAIKADLAREHACNVGNLKFSRCADALVERLEGEVPAGVLAAYAKASRGSYAARLASAGLSKQEYMQQEDLSESQFEAKLVEDVKFQIKLSAALDLIARESGDAVADEDLTAYLSVEDPDTFLQEARDKGKLEEARAAALRVKTMRGIVDGAQVEEAEE